MQPKKTTSTIFIDKDSWLHKTHPFTTPPETVKRILALSLEHPGWGCIKLSSMLKLEEINVSSPTIQNILIKNNMGSIYERMLKLEEKAAQKAIELTPEQVAQIEKYNPCFRERHVESSRPGELLSQDTFYVGTLKGVGRVYLHGILSQCDRGNLRCKYQYGSVF